MEPVGESESVYTELHLYVAAQYLEAVRPYRHVWAPREAQITLPEVEHLAARVNEFVTGQLDAEMGRTLLVDVERFLVGIDPFGPLSEVIDFFQPGLKTRLRNQGRLYVELRRAATMLAAELSEIDQDDRLTQPMDGLTNPGMDEIDDLRSTQVIGEEESLRSKAVQEAIDNVLAAVSSVFDESDEEEEAIDTSLPSATEMKFEGSKKKDPEQAEVAEVRLQAPMAEGLEEESSEPIVLRTEEKSEADEEPGGDGEEERLFVDDSFHVEENGDTLEEAASRDEVQPKVRRGKSEEKSVPNRIDELNRLRQVYLKDQRWEELVQLYEAELELFRDPQELQTVYLVMATLYETKLDRPERALTLFGKAFEVSGGEGRKKAQRALNRLGEKAPGAFYEIVRGLLMDPNWDTDDRLWLRRQEVLAVFRTRGVNAARETILEIAQSEGEIFFVGEGLEIVTLVGAAREGGRGELINELVDAGMSGELFTHLQYVTKGEG